jgi:uncharacterized sulfatase
MSRFPLTILVGLLVGSAGPEALSKPNVLLILADDCTYNDLPVYGGQNARTPHLDRLALQGLTFDRAYLSEAICQPCRAELYSGLYPMGNGCAWNHSASRATVRSLPHHLGDLGYRVGLAGKVHVGPRKAFPFEQVPGFDRSCVRNPTKAHDLAGVREFMTRDPRQPFCLVVALVEPHVPWVMGDRSAYPPKQIKLPENIADTPRTREDFGAYLAEITYMDGQVGELLGTLEKGGRAKDTLVLFSSEQGSQFPGCKWTNWDTGVHTALIARWPGRVPAGLRTDAVVQYADVLPTLVDLAGGKARGCDGSSFARVLTGEAKAHREFAYGVHNNLPEGPPYPIRTVTDGTYRYIRNLKPDNLYIEKHLMGPGPLNNPYWTTWVNTAWNHPRTLRLVERYMRRPTEQLYHTAQDPYEMKNMAGDPAHAETLARLRAELDRWLKAEGDPGAVMDTMEVYQASRRGQHPYPKPRD